VETDGVLGCTSQLPYGIMSSGSSIQPILGLSYGARHNFWPLLNPLDGMPRS
jgi:hypothetical protein